MQSDGNLSNDCQTCALAGDPCTSQGALSAPMLATDSSCSCHPKIESQIDLMKGASGE